MNHVHKRYTLLMEAKKNNCLKVADVIMANVCNKSDSFNTNVWWNYCLSSLEKYDNLDK